MDKRKRNNYVRLLMSDRDVGWLIYSYATIGFFKGNETNLIMAILREANSNENGLCCMKQGELADYSCQSLSEMKRNLTSLTRLEFISSKTVNGRSIKYFNKSAIDVLKRVYRGQNKKSICVLREEMKRLGIKSLLDVDEKMMKIVCEIAGEKFIDDGDFSPNTGQTKNENTSMQGIFKKSMVTADDMRIELVNRKNSKQKNS